MMGVRESHKAVADGGVFEMGISDGKHHAMMRVTDRCLRNACELGPQAVWDLLTNEFAGLLGALENRQNNVPAVGAFVTIGSSEVRRQIISINRRTNTVGLFAGPGEPPHEVPWSSCRYI